jgi:hypothetical protein
MSPERTLRLLIREQLASTERLAPTPGDPSDDLYVFDFDDTLGKTDSPTIVAAVDFGGGDPTDPKSYTPVRDLRHRLQSSGIPTLGSVLLATDLPPELRGDVSGRFISGTGTPLDGAEAVSLDTAQYRDWKEKYIPSVGKRTVVGGDVQSKLTGLGSTMSRPGEIHVTDFSPSSTLGDVRPIQSTISLLKQAEDAGADTAVITARKGRKNLDTISGGKKKANNANDIYKFLSKFGVKPDRVIGAADISNSTADNKRKMIKSIAKVKKPDEIKFFDDDPENVNAVHDLCNDEELAGTQISLYNADFEHEGIPDPSSVCRPRKRN